jgi:hypothetical protein
MKHFSFEEEFSYILAEMSKCLHVKYQLFLMDFDET